MNTQIESDIYSQIISKVKDKKPLPTWYKNANSAGVIFFISGCLGGAILFFTFLTDDFFENTKICRSADCLVSPNLLEIRYEYGVIALLLLATVHTVYRSTDWPHVKERTWIFVCLITSSIVISTSFIFWIQSSGPGIADTFHDVKRNLIEVTPWRKKVQYTLNKAGTPQQITRYFQIAP